MRAWWAYWLTLIAGAVLWTAAAVVAPHGAFGSILREPVWLVLLLAPLLAAGVNLIAFRRSHEEVCQIEVAQHKWLRFLVGPGYSSGTFALTGSVLLGLVAAILIGLVTGAL